MVKTNPLVSVILPVYNAERTVAEAIESILNQTYKNIELVIVNDGSVDSSAVVINSFVHDKRVRVFTRPNSGVVDTLNYALSQAKGDFIARMDADDISYPTRIERQLQEFVDDSSIVCIGSQYKAFGAKSYVSRLPTNEILLSQFSIFYPPFAHPTVMFRRCEMKYSKDALHIEDYDMWQKMAKLGKLKNLNTVELMYRFHPNQVSTHYKAIQSENHAMLCAKTIEEKYGIRCDAKLVEKMLFGGGAIFERFLVFFIIIRLLLKGISPAILARLARNALK